MGKEKALQVDGRRNVEDVRHNDNVYLSNMPFVIYLKDKRPQGPFFWQHQLQFVSVLKFINS
jgi:hypothetical protein